MIFHVAQDKIQVGVTGIRLRDGLGAEIDADAVGRLQRSEQISATAAEFQHPLAGRNQKLHELAIVFVIGGVEFAPAIQLVAIGLEMIEQIALALAGQLQRSSGIGLLQIHCSLEPESGEILLAEGH